jgi:hypothetical protein
MRGGPSHKSRPARACAHTNAGGPRPVDVTVETAVTRGSDPSRVPLSPQSPRPRVQADSERERERLMGQRAHHGAPSPAMTASPRAVRGRTSERRAKPSAGRRRRRAGGSGGSFGGGGSATAAAGGDLDPGKIEVQDTSTRKTAVQDTPTRVTRMPGPDRRRGAPRTLPPHSPRSRSRGPERGVSE